MNSEARASLRAEMTLQVATLKAIHFTAEDFVEVSHERLAADLNQSRDTLVLALEQRNHAYDAVCSLSARPRANSTAFLVGLFALGAAVGHLISMVVR